MTVPEIKKVKGSTYCVNIKGTYTGIYMLPDSEIVMIDSGGQPSDYLFEWLNENRLSVRAVIHTHFHIDHIANSKKLQDIYGAKMYASEGEPLHDVMLTEEGRFEPFFNPCNGEVSIGSASFSTVPTPGHSLAHQLVITPDEVCFAGDAILTEGYLDKCLFPYMHNSIRAVESMTKVEEVGNSMFAVVASHSGLIPQASVTRTVQLNIEKEKMLFDLLMKTAVRPMEKQIMADRFMAAAGVESQAVRNYWWMKETAENTIEEMLRRGRLKTDGKLIFS